MEAIKFVQTEDTKPLAIVELVKDQENGEQVSEYGIVLGRDEVMPVRYETIDKAMEVINSRSWELLFNMMSWTASQACINHKNKK